MEYNVKTIVKKHTACDEEINLEMDLLYDLGINSLEMVSLVLDIEDKLGIEFAESDLVMSDINTVGDLEGLIKRYL